jgi:fatty acid desaturase
MGIVPATRTAFRRTVIFCALRSLNSCRRERSQKEHAMLIKPEVESETLTPLQLRALSERQDEAGLVRAAAHWGSVFAVGFLIWRVGKDHGLLWAFPLMVVQGLLVAFLFCALHECMHKTAFRSKWLNVLVGYPSGFAIAWPYEYYFVYHWAHHRHTQDPERDPELVGGKIPDSDTRLAILFSGASQIYGRFRVLFRHAVAGHSKMPWVPASKQALVVNEARAFLLIYAALIAGSVALHTGVLLWVWLVPLLIGQVFLRPYLLAEHTGCSLSRSSFENTRTTAASAVLRWLSWNMPYHAEHHAYPAVPFHALPRLHEVVSERIVHRGRSYPAVAREVWAWLRGARQA